MKPICIRHTQLPGISNLFRDYLYDFSRLKQFYEIDPHQSDAFRQSAAPIDFPLERRQQLVAALAVQNPGSPLLDSLAQSDTVAVVTGQQVGLYGGPLYSIYKALTAVRVATDLQQQGIRAVPIFWLATEDHDFAEIQNFDLFDGSFQSKRLSLDWKDEDHVPVGWRSAGSYPNQKLKEAIAGLPLGSEVADAVSAAYRDGQTLGAAFQQLMQWILGRHQMLFLDPLRPEIRRLGAPLLAKAAESSVDLSQSLLDRNQELSAAGYHAQVHWEKTNSLFFHLDGSLRRSLKRDGENYTAEGQRWTGQQLAADAEKLSPNALLRPVWQDFMLPTVAYVGGPAELAYFAQSQVLYQKLLGRMPVMLSRAFFTILDARSQVILDRHRLTLPEICTFEANLKERFARKLVPAELDQRLHQACQTIRAEVSGMKAALTGFDPTLVAALEKSESKIRHQLDRIRAKSAREALRRDQAAADDADYLYGQLYPHQTLQERVFGALPFIARYGEGFVDTIYDHIGIGCHDHVQLPM
jgi:bacillithiol synthase